MDELETLRERVKLLESTLQNLLPIINRILLSDDDEQAITQAAQLVEYPTNGEYND